MNTSNKIRNINENLDWSIDEFDIYDWSDVVALVHAMKEEIQYLLSSNQELKAIKSAINVWEVFSRVHLDDLPENILRPEDKNYYLYKCRTSFRHALIMSIEDLINNKFIENSWDVQEYQNQLYQKNTQRRTEKDIEIINKIIKNIIMLLENKLETFNNN